MLRVCIDTNVWLSGLIFSSAPAEIVDLALRKQFHLVLSSFILDEVERNLIKKFSVQPTSAAQLRYRIAEIADVYEPEGNVDIVQDTHADNLVLETAWLGRAHYLVTGDKKHLLPLKTFRSTEIISPSDFLALLKNKHHG